MAGRAGLLAAALVAALVVAGAAAYYVASSRGGPAQATTALPVVRVGTLRGGVSSLDVMLAEHLDSRHGIRVEPHYFTTTLDLANALAHGDIDVAIIPAEFVAKLRASGVNVTILAVDFYQNQAIVVQGGSGIRSPRDLVGKRVAVFKPTGTYAMFRAYMRILYGIDVERDLELVNAPPPQIVQAFARHEVDAAVIWEPFVSKLVAEYGGRILASYRDLWGNWTGHVGPNGVMIVYAARTAWARGHPGLVSKLLAARSDAARLWDEDESLAARILEGSYGLSGGAARLCWERLKMEQAAGLDRAMIENILAVWRLAWEGGYINVEPEAIAQGAFWQGG